MEMTNREIIANYKAAKNKKNQIKILADLNMCTQKEIRVILGLEPNKEKAAEPVVKPVKEEAKEEIKQEVKKVPAVHVPESIFNLASIRLKELEEIIDNAKKEYAEIAEFFGMGA